MGGGLETNFRYFDVLGYVSSISHMRIVIAMANMTVEDVYGVEAVRGYDPVKSAELCKTVRSADLTQLGDLDAVHPYYVEKAETLKQAKRFDADADMRALAAWAEHWNELPGNHRVAVVDSSGTIWGYANVGNGYREAQYLSSSTCARFGFDMHPELGIGMSLIEKRIGRPVITVTISSFSGASEYGERQREERARKGAEARHE
ncbi:hypothetical protein BCHO_0857 [Bifidobacterium choerinum]|uniref:Uncharacterized protein n=2 Tax=Bifidobacterium choerinum TaxID=35760 RepID=A0A087AF88_9BIFI|nr:hypothetical protein BCHO_0857 [Bifidobacterium choerinum]